jgi:hypothetical protein
MSRKNKRNTCFTRTSGLANARQIIQWMIILTVTFSSLRNNYWTACALQTNNNSTLFFGTSQSAYFGIHFQLLLVWVQHGNFETYIVKSYNKCTILMSRPTCANTTHTLKYIFRHRDSNLQTWSSHQRQSPTMPTGLRGNKSNQPKYSCHLCFAFGRLGNVININSCFSSN